MARRFGMPGTVERAEQFLTREDRSFEAIVARLNEERAALELARAAAEQREGEAREASERLDAEWRDIRSREKSALSEEARALLERVRTAREELRAAQARLRANAKKPDAASLRDAERSIERAAAEVSVGGALDPWITPPEEAPREPVSVRELRKGARVWVPRPRADAEVVDLLAGDMVRVAAGPLKLTVSAGELRASARVDPAAPRPAGRSSAGRSRSEAGLDLGRP